MLLYFFFGWDCLSQIMKVLVHELCRSLDDEVKHEVRRRQQLFWKIIERRAVILQLRGDAQ